MRRISVGFAILFCAAILAACGDTGDHFGEFRQGTPPPTVAQQVTVNMPVIPGSLVASAKLPMYVTTYNGGQAVRIGTALANPIIITTNYEGYVRFSSPTGPAGKTYNHLSLQAAPPAITVYYKRPPVGLCRNGAAPPVVVTIYNHDANPQFVTQNLTGCGTGPSPSPSTKPTGSPKPSGKPSATPSPVPTPVQPTVKKLALAMPSTPNPLSPGTFTLVVTAFGANSKALPPGTVLTNPIQLTSNSSCSISYSFNGATGTSLTLTTAPGSVGLSYTPASATCTPPSSIILSAFDLDAKPQTAQFAILGGTATVASFTLTALANPDPASAGVYPLFVTAKDNTGATIPFGITLTNPIQLSSNASCATGFGLTSSPGTFTPTFQISSTQTQVFMQFLGNNSSCKTPPATVTVTGVAAGGVSAMFSFPF